MPTLESVDIVGVVTMYDVTGNDHIIDGCEFDIAVIYKEGDREYALEVTADDEGSAVTWVRENCRQLLARFKTLGELQAAVGEVFEDYYDFMVWGEMEVPEPVGEVKAGTYTVSYRRKFDEKWPAKFELDCKGSGCIFWEESLESLKERLPEATLWFGKKPPA